MPRLAAIRRLFARLLGALARRLDPGANRPPEPPTYVGPGQDQSLLP